MIVCPGCASYVGLTSTGQVPPWCPKCGSDLKAMPARPAAPTEPTPQFAAHAAPTASRSAPPRQYDPDAEVAPIDHIEEAIPARAEHPPWALQKYDAYAEKHDLPTSSLPWWAVLFAVLCGLIPVATLGGAIPGMIGFGAASICIGVGRNRNLSLSLRFGICLLITFAAWAATAAIIWQFLRWRNVVR